jgi:UDP-GlcNAc:undecaprenyl-phosphate GlcNAc-1-phosphate transferase
MMFLNDVILSALLSFVAVLALAPVAIAICIRIGWLDKPDLRKQHKGHVPIAGGLSIALSVVLAWLVIAIVDGRAPSGVVEVLWPGAALVFTVGFLDDRTPLRARHRFAVQLVAALVFVGLSGAAVDRMGELVGPQFIALGMFAIPFTVLGIVGLTNAVNMVDGVDGLAGGVVFVAFAWVLLAFAHLAHDVASVDPSMVPQAHSAAMVASVLTGALLGFLFFNQRAPWRRRAAMFLGDGGSMTLGFVLGALLVYASSGFGPHGLPPVTAVWIAAIPLFDLCAAILRRDLAGTTPMTPDRRHVHHLLLALGLSPASAVMLLQGVGLLAGFVGVLGWRLGVPDYAMFWSLVALFAAYFAATQSAWQRLEATTAATRARQAAYRVSSPAPQPLIQPTPQRVGKAAPERVARRDSDRSVTVR